MGTFLRSNFLNSPNLTPPTFAIASSGLHGPLPLGGLKKACPEPVSGCADNNNTDNDILERYDSAYPEPVYGLSPIAETPPHDNRGISVVDFLFFS